MSLRVFVTGGTFDKDYDYLKGELYFQDTQLPEMLRLGRCTVDINLRTLMMIDSLEMTEEDRNLIVRNCKACPEDKIVITHGTDTMVTTASRIAQSGIEGKTVVLTGAMVPYKFGSSDGFFNLGSALAFAQTGIVIGASVMAYFKKSPEVGVLSVVLGVTLMHILMLVPVVGGIAFVTIFLLTLGAVVEKLARIIRSA